MQKYFISPLDDDLVKAIFGDQRNIENTAAFLKAVLRPPVADIPPEDYEKLTIKDPFLNRLRKDDKRGILDVRLTTKTGRVISVEIQINPYKAMPQRIIFYNAKLVTEQMKKGFDYDKLHQTISVVVLDYKLWPEKGDYLNTYELRNIKTGRPFTDLIKVITIELPKAPETDNGHPLWPWLAFFKCKSKEELAMLSKLYPQVKPAVEEHQKMSWSDRRRMRAEAREKWYRDRRAEIAYARDEGLEKGRQEVLELMAQGYTPEQIKDALERTAP